MNVERSSWAMRAFTSLLTCVANFFVVFLVHRAHAGITPIKIFFLIGAILALVLFLTALAQFVLTYKDDTWQ